MHALIRRSTNRQAGLGQLRRRTPRRSARLTVQIICACAALILLSLKVAAQTMAFNDCNGNGVPDERDVVPASFGFAPQVLYSAGTGVRQLSALDYKGHPLDVNKDGYPDLLVSNLYSHTISVLLNRRDGTFRKAGDFKAGRFPLSMTFADFDLDGHVDIAVASWTAKTWSILRGESGGRFRLTEEFPLKGRPSVILATDIDDDGRPDLVVSMWTGPIDERIRVYRNTEGGFKLHDVVGGGYGGPFRMNSGDFDDDGDLDLSIVQITLDGILIYSNRGDGTYEPFVQYDTHPESVNVGIDGIIAEDFDLDGDLDLALSNWWAEYRGWGDLRILENRGNGTFRSYVRSYEEYGPMRYPIEGNANDVIAGDFDNDGLLDIAMPVTDDRGSNVVIMRNQGNLQFGPPAYFPAMHNPVSITAADFNLDGILDIATANFEHSDTVSVLLGRTTGPPFSNDCNFNGVPDECDVADGTSTDNNENGVPDECERCIGDLNQSGFVDWVDANGHPNFYGCEVGVGLWWCDEADVDGSGHVNPADVGAIMQDYGPCP